MSANNAIICTGYKKEGNGIDIASITDVDSEREWLLLDNEHEVVEIEEVEEKLLLIKNYRKRDPPLVWVFCIGAIYFEQK